MWLGFVYQGNGQKSILKGGNSEEDSCFQYDEQDENLQMEGALRDVLFKF
jgi:hypothetical protein